MEPDLIAGLAKLSAREHLPVSALVRRAIRRELEREGILSSDRQSRAETTKRKRKTS
jgi:ribbon-helix-helix CopG family protein